MKGKVGAADAAPAPSSAGDGAAAGAAAAPAAPPGALVTDHGVKWGEWFMEDLNDDDDEDDEDFRPTLHACTTIFVVLSFE